MHRPHQKRKRGVLLTLQGLHKLENARQQAENDENDTKRFTLENLMCRTGLDSHTLGKIFNRTARVDQRSLVRCFLAFSLVLEPGDYEPPSGAPCIRRERQDLESNVFALERLEEEATHISTPNLNAKIQFCSDDGSMPDVSIFYGRSSELATLHQWIETKSSTGRTASQRGRLIALSGQAGIGKTWLAAKLVDQMQDDFEYVFWRSLHQAPSVTNLLTQFIQFVCKQSDVDEAQPLNHQITQAIDYLRSSRCLLVLDNVETILLGCDQRGCNRFAGHYCSDYEGYRVFLKRVAETNHQSCVVLTSREIPQDIRPQNSDSLPIRGLLVKGLPVAQIQKLLQHQGVFQGTLVDWCRLANRYGSNPLILKSVGKFIQGLFGGNIAAFLNQDIVLFDEICDLLHQQLKRLSDAEINLLMVLARQSNPVSFSEVRSQMFGSISNQTLLEGLTSLEMRSLLEIRDGQFFLQPLLASYIRERYYATRRF